MGHPLGFVPPVALPGVGSAVNVIVPTGGILGGAASGATAGALLGPKGALVGAVLGAALGGLALALPLSPGTLPSLDPGLNDPEPSPDPERVPIPDTPPTPVPVPPGKEGHVLLWEVTYVVNETFPESRFCPETGGQLISPERPTDTSAPKTKSYVAESISIELVQGYLWNSCGDLGLVENKIVDALIVYLTGGPNDGTIMRDEEVVQTRYIGPDTNDPGRRKWIEIQEITADGEPVPNPMPKPQTPKKPRPLPVPLVPLPVPGAPTEPLPEPLPEPQPLIVPSPGAPSAPPVEIPGVPPADPQPLPRPSPAPLPRPLPAPLPIPSPVPGVPTVPEPSPDPNISPTPDPVPLPIPAFPKPPATPDTSVPTTSDGSVAPVPRPKPVPTPPTAHFPVSGGDPITPGGASTDPVQVAQEIGRLEQKMAQGLNQGLGLAIRIGDLIDALAALDALFKAPYPAGSYAISGVCERDADGNPMEVTRSSTYLAAPGIGAVLTRLDAMADLFQYHKELRQPICKPPRGGGGDLVTVNFVSDEPSPQGEKPLRKFLRYRDQTNRNLLVHGAHWRDFSWQAGPVCVCHKNGPWGVLQVWAVSAGEGKRVIRHAGAVAGVDPDSVGEWLVTGSSDPRYGQPGTMRVERRIAGELRQEFLRVTKRSDPNGLPLLPAA